MRPGRTTGPWPALAAWMIAASLSLHALPAAAVGPYRPPRPVVKTLDNGLRIFVFHDPRLPLVEIALRVPAGLSAEPADQNGIANLTARMVGRGTTSRNAETFANDLARLGTGLTAQTSREYTTISTAFLSRDFEGGLELLGDAVSHPVFLEDEFRRNQNQAGRAVIQSRQNPAATANEQLWTLAFPEVPLAQPPLGRIETLSRLTIDQVRSFYRDRYRPDGAVLAIAGDVTPERAQAVAADWFGSWMAGAAPAAPAAQARAAAARIRIVDLPASAGCAIAAGLVVPGHGAPDAMARSVAASLFDHQLTERLARGPVREARSTLELTRDAGLWIVQGVSPADSAAAAVRRITSEWKRFLAAPPALPEVTAVQQRIRRGFPLAFETAANLMSQWLHADFAGFPQDHFAGYAARVGALKPNDLHAAARREASLERLQVVVVGPAAKLEPLLAPLGTVEVVASDRGAEAPAPSDSLPPATSEQIAAARKLVTQALAAHGGRDRLSGIRSSLVDAQIRFEVPGSEVTGTLRQMRKHPDRLALMTSVRGVDTRQVLNGKRAWTVLAESDTVRAADSLDVAALQIAYRTDLPGVLLAASDKNARVAARGRERIAGREVDKIEVVTATDPWRMLYLDTATRRLVGFDQRERGPRGQYLARRVYGDFRPLDGIQWPYREERFVSNHPLMTLDVTGVQLNVELNESFFAPPKAAGTPWR